VSSRYFNTSFWNDPWVRTLTCQERDLFIYLLTNERTNIAGVYEIAQDRIAFDTRLTPRVIVAAMATFEGAGKAYYRNGWVVMRNAPKHQSLTSDKTLKGIQRILAAVPQEIEDLLYEIRYQLDPYKEGHGRGMEGAWKDLQGACKGHIPGNKGLRYYTLLNARGGGPVPPAAAGAERLFRDFQEIIADKERENLRDKKTDDKA
jgi:hypothetical protein